MTASDQAQLVVGQAKEQVANVTDEAQAQAQRVLSSATTELSGQLDQRLGTATSAARTGDLAHEASQRLERLADRVDELGVRGVTEEVTDFACRRPVAFLVGAAAAGLLVGQLARAGKAYLASTEKTSARALATP